MKFRKNKINTGIQENKISCWDIAEQSFKLMNESFGSLEKTVKTLKNGSNLLKNSKKLISAKTDDLVSQTIQDLKNSIILSKISKMDISETIKILEQNPTIISPFRLPN